VTRLTRRLSVQAGQADWDLRARYDEVCRTRSAPDVVVGSVHVITGANGPVITSGTGPRRRPPLASMILSHLEVNLPAQTGR
jgi:hypothetical protein